MAVLMATAIIPAATPSRKRPTASCQMEVLVADTTRVTTASTTPAASGRPAPARSAQSPPSTPPNRLAATKQPATSG